MSDIPPPEPEAGTVLGGKNDHLSVAQPSVSKGKRWKIILQNIAVGTAVLGNIVALGSLALTTCNFNKQLKIQNRLAKKHIEEDYLRHALSVVFDCYNAADVYVSSWSYYKKRANISKARSAPIKDQMEIDRLFLQQWHEFDREVSSISELLLTERDYQLRNLVDQSKKSSAHLLDELFKNPDLFESDEQFEKSPLAHQVFDDAHAAARALASRLDALYSGRSERSKVGAIK